MSPTKPWKHPCTGTNRQGQPCRKWAIVGGTVCPTHGGSVGRVKAAAERRIQAEAAEHELAELRTLGHPVPTDQVDPGQALLAMVGEAIGNVNALRRLVAEMPSPVDEAAREHALAELYRAWCGHQADFATRALRAGVEERQARVDESLVEILGRFVRDLLAAPELGLAVDVQQVGLEVAGRLMRALPAA